MQQTNAEILLAVKGGSGTAVQFQWTYPPFQNVSTIPSWSLMQSYHVIGSPFALAVAPSTLSPATSRVSGQAVSLATAGILVSFNVQVNEHILAFL